jgi:hypothetical protein
MRKIDLQEALTRQLKLTNPRFKLERFGNKLGGSVISKTFKGKGDSDRLEMIWDALEAEFGRDAVRKIGTLLPYTDEEWDIDIEPHDNNADTRRRARPGSGSSSAVTMMAVPVKLVPKVQKLISGLAG